MKRMDRFFTVLLIYLVLFTACGFGYALGMIAPRDSTQKPKEDVHESIRQELERYRGLYQTEHERVAREYEAKKGFEAQLAKLRAAVAKAAKL